MTVGAEETGQGTETGAEEISVAQNVDTNEGDNGSGDGDSINPAWNPLLEKLPSSLHNLVTPELRNWDKNYQKSLNEVHSQYAPYKEYVENKVEPDQINYALKMLEAINTRPLDVINALNEYAKQNGLIQEPSAPQGNEQQGQVDDSEIPDELLQHPKFVEMQKQLEQVTGFLAQQQQSQLQAQQDKEIQDELTELRKPERYGEFDEDWVITKAIQDAHSGKQVTSLEPYVKQFKEFEKKVAEKVAKPGPTVLPPGGIVPDNQLDVKTLSDKDRRALVIQQLAAAAQNNQ